MKQYKDFTKNVLAKGTTTKDRTGVGTISMHANRLSHNLQEGFPLLTTKRLPFKSILTEWKWMMLGMTDVRWLQDNNCTIWDEWATISQCNKFGRMVGDLGPVYGHQWRNFGAARLLHTDTLWELWRDNLLNHFPIEECGYDDISNPYELRDSIYQKFYADIMRNYTPSWSSVEFGINDAQGKYLYFYHSDGFDQIAWLIRELIHNPTSRRLIVSGWNPREAGEVALPPCHTLWQLKVSQPAVGSTDAPSLNLSLHQRSGDTFLGVPFNQAFYGFMIEFFATMLQFKAGELVLNVTDSHIYSNHMDAVNTQLDREEYALPKITFSEEYTKKLQNFASTVRHSVSAKSDDLSIISCGINELISSMVIGEDVILNDYLHHPVIRADVAV